MKKTRELNFTNFLDYLREINFLNASDLDANTSIEEITKIDHKKNLLEFCTVRIDNLENSHLAENILQSEISLEDDKEKENMKEDEELFKKICGIKIEIKRLHSIYKEINYISDQNNYIYNLSEFSYLFKILNYILLNFNDDILKLNLKKVYDDNVIFYFLKNSNNLNFDRKEDNFQNKNERIDTNNYKNIIDNYFNDNSSEKLDVYKNLLFLFFVFTMGHQLKFSSNNHMKMNNFIFNLSVYMNLYNSHYNYFLLIHFSMIIFYNLALREESSKSNLDLLFAIKDKKKSHKNNEENTINKAVINPSIYLFENITNKDIEDELIKNCIVINQTKFYLFNYFSNSQNIIFNFYSSSTDLIKNSIFYYEFKSNEISKKLKIYKTFLIMFDDLQFLNQKNFSLDEIMINIPKNIEDCNEINLIKKYENLFLKSKNLIIRDNVSQMSEFVSIDTLYKEIELLQFIINFTYKIYNLKKKKKEIFNFYVQINLFNFYFKKYIPPPMQVFDKKDFKNEYTNLIYLSFNYSNLKEKELLENVSQMTFYSKLYLNFKEIIKSLINYKKTHFNFNILKNNFESDELNLIFSTLILSLKNYIEEKSIKHFELDDNLVDLKHTLTISNIYREKEKKIILYKRLKKLQNPTFVFLNKLSDQIITYFNQILIHDYIDNNCNFSPIALFRNFKENKIIIKNSNLSSNYYIFDVYIFDKLFLERIMNFIKNIKSEQNFTSQINLIVNKTFFEDVMIKEFENFSNVYLNLCNINIINNSVEYDYDICVLEKKIILITHQPILMSKKGNKNEMVTKKIMIEIFKVLFDSFNSKNKNSSLNILLNSKENFFTKFLFVFKAFSNSSINIINLKNESFYLQKLPKEYRKTYQIFNNFQCFKSKNTLLKFSLSKIKDNVFDYENDLITKSILQKILQNINSIFENLNIAYKNLKASDIVFEKISIIIDNFIKFLGENFLPKNYLPVAYSYHKFKKFITIFKNFYLLKNGNIFDKIYLIPLKYDQVKLNEFVKKFTVILSEENSNCNNEYFVTKNILIYETEIRQIEGLNSEFNDLILKGIPFHHSHLMATLKLIESNYRKVENSEYKLNFKNLSTYMISLLLILHKNKNLKENLQNKQKILKLILSFMQDKINIVVFHAKSHLFEAMIMENVKEKKHCETSLHLKTNQKFESEEKSQSKDEKIVLEKIFDQSKNNKSEKQRKSKKCIIY